MPSKLAQAKQMLVQASCNPKVPPAERQRCMNALIAANESSRPKAQRRAVSAPAAMRGSSSDADIARSALLASRPDFSPEQIATLQRLDLAAVKQAVRDWPRQDLSQIPAHLRDQLEAVDRRLASAGQPPRAESYVDEYGFTRTHVVC